MLSNNTQNIVFKFYLIEKAITSMYVLEIHLKGTNNQQSCYENMTCI